MKRLLLAACCAMLLGTVNAHADDLIPIDEEHFPDANFREWVLKYANDGNGNVDISLTRIPTTAYLTDDDPFTIPMPFETEPYGVTDWTGIEHFVNLEYFLHNIGLVPVELDLSKNKKLRGINIAPGLTLKRADMVALTKLNVSGLTDLEYLFCPNTSITELDLTGMSKLVYVVAETNVDGRVGKIITLGDLSECVSLQNILVGNNQLTSLDLRNTKELGELYCEENKLTSLDLSNCENIRTLNAHSNINDVKALKAINRMADGTVMDVYYMRLDDVEGHDNHVNEAFRNAESWYLTAAREESGFALSNVVPGTWVNAEVYHGNKGGNDARRRALADTYRLVADHVEGDLLLLDPDDHTIQYQYYTDSPQQASDVTLDSKHLSVAPDDDVTKITFQARWSADNVITWIDDVEEVKPIASERYVNLNGQVSDEPWQGVNVVVTTCTDGTRHTTKRVY